MHEHQNAFCLWSNWGHWIPSLNFQSKGIIELYDAAGELSIVLDGAGGFCTLLFCLDSNELHQITSQKPLTMETIWEPQCKRTQFEQKKQRTGWQGCVSFKYQLPTFQLSSLNSKPKLLFAIHVKQLYILSSEISWMKIPILEKYINIITMPSWFTEIKTVWSIICDYKMQSNKCGILCIWIWPFVPKPKASVWSWISAGLWPSCIDFTKPDKSFACRHSLLDLSLASEAE